MTLTQLTYFLEIVRTKNFTVAASNLFVSQSSLSYAIRELETELDVPLFLRRPNKRIELTEYGEALLPYAEEGLRVIEEGKNLILGMRSPLHGQVRLGFFHSIIFSAIPDLLQRFRRDNPGNEIEFKTVVFHNWVDLREMLLDRKCDLVLSAGNLGNGCESVRIADHRIYLLAPHDHPIAMKPQVRVPDLQDVTLFQIDPGSNMDNRIHEMMRSEGTAPRIVYTEDWTTQQLAVINGKGLALSCDAACDERYIRKIPVESDYAVLPLYLTWPSNSRMSGAAVYVRDYYLRLAREMPDLVF